MSEYKVGEKVKITSEVSSARYSLAKGTTGLITNDQHSAVELVVEGVGLVSISKTAIKKKVAKVEKLVKAKNLKLTDEVRIPGSGEYNKLANIYRNDYDSADPTISVETVIYDSKDYGYNELVEVRR